MASSPGVVDGNTAVTKSSAIRITAVNDAPTINASAVLGGVTAGIPRVITHAELSAATGARDTESAAVQFTITSLRSGRIDKWNGSRWVTVWNSASLQMISPVDVVIGVGEKIRWVPAARATTVGTVFGVRASDGELKSANVCAVTLAAT